jgi:hypothetical protein
LATGPEENETPAQRQAAAKVALRKQLEKTLLQIPPPKPPPPEMNYLPNPNNFEFLALIGLEFVVDYITKDPNEPLLTPEPFTCSQCKTDFSSIWKWDKVNKGKDFLIIYSIDKDNRYLSSIPQEINLTN